MDLDKQQEIFEEKYQHKLGMTYEEWLEQAPETEDQAYEKLAEIDMELKQVKEDLEEAAPEYKDDLEDERDRLKLEYELLEEMFGLELDD
jgi:uncharacterized protein YukE